MSSDSPLAVLLREERRLVARLRGVLRFDPAVYRELQRDSHAIPQAIAVVVVTAAVASLGAGSLVLVFLMLSLAIVQWMVITALVWAVGRFAVERMVEYSQLLRCSGFAYAWFALLAGASLPLVGGLFAWAAVLASFVSLVVATRVVLETDTARALAICVLALGLPMATLFWLVPLS